MKSHKIIEFYCQFFSLTLSLCSLLAHSLLTCTKALFIYFPMFILVNLLLFIFTLLYLQQQNEKKKNNWKHCYYWRTFNRKNEKTKKTNIIRLVIFFFFHSFLPSNRKSFHPKHYWSTQSLLSMHYRAIEQKEEKKMVIFSGWYNATDVIWIKSNSPHFISIIVKCLPNQKIFILYISYHLFSFFFSLLSIIEW